MTKCWRDEYRELQFQELDLLDYYIDVEDKQLQALERYRCLVEKGLLWLRDCFVEELEELITQEANVVVGYMNMDARNIKMSLRKKHLSEKFLSYFKRI